VDWHRNSKSEDVVTFNVAGAGVMTATLANAANSADISTENSTGNCGAITLGTVTVGGAAQVAGGTVATSDAISA
jgi:hypothetical protein